ncbi:hypothetical protein CITRIK5_80021 [Citricoccus sp. K5]|nr:hypothetical protein CITRIK5_80021 [Citricoccus sp. K5]
MGLNRIATLPGRSLLAADSITNAIQMGRIPKRIGVDRGRASLTGSCAVLERTERLGR